MNNENEIQEIDKAFQLIKETNFQTFVNILTKDYPAEIKFWFGDRIKELPDTNDIFKHHAETLAGREQMLSKMFTNVPDPKLGLQNFLGIISSDILRNEQTLLKIRQGYTGFLNMEVIGRLWSASDIIKKYYSDLQNFDQAKPKTEAKPLPELPAIFTDKNDLVKLVKLLKENNFVSEEAGQLLWTGKYNENARGEGLQLVTLSEVCRPFYNSNYNAKQLNHAWTKYFNYKMSAVKWQDGEKDKHISDSYLRLFQFVDNIR
jgi:hypothetical protein